LTIDDSNNRGKAAELINDRVLMIVYLGAEGAFILIIHYQFSIIH